MNRGLSGAQVIINGDFVTKMVASSASDTQRNRLGDQARWLRQHASLGVPRVFECRDNSYVMERLFPVPAAITSREHLLTDVVLQLRGHVWSRDPIVPYNAELTQAKITQLIKRFNLEGLWPSIYRLHGAVRWARVDRVLTHGDPTLDNVMLRPNTFTSDVVLIDPVPATAAIPDLLVVDAGKILQSLLGFEEVIYGEQTPLHLRKMSPVHLHWNLFIGDENGWRATVFWAVVHLLRTLPYVPTSVIPRVKELITSATVLV